MYRNWRQSLIAKIWKFTQIINRYWNQLIDWQTSWDIISSVARTAKMLIGHAPIGMDDTPRRRICFKVLAFGRRIFRELANNSRLHIFIYSDTYKTKRIFKKKATRRTNVHNHFHHCGNWNVPSFLLTKDVKLDYPSNKRSDKPSFPSGNARPRLFSLRVYAKAGRRRNVSMEDLRGSRVVAVHDYETLKSRSMMHDKCFY